MTRLLIFSVAVLGALAASVWLVRANHESTPDTMELLNVSYDPTRELWQDMNARFIARYTEQTGVRLTIHQSHGGSATQALAIMEGLDADVATLGLWSDTDAIRKAGLIRAGWEERLPHHSLPYFSTIVFVVRKGNPHGIQDWPDLLQPGVQVITPNPKTSGNGRLSFLAAWGSVIQRGGSEEAAHAFVTQLYQRVPVLDTGARGATATFASKKIGDVHLTWENEGYLEVQESRGELELVRPRHSIRAEPYVAVVDANVDRRGTRAAAEAYLRYLYTDEAQEIIARHYYRPINPQILRQHADLFPPLDLFPITLVAPSWDAAEKRFFASGGIFDSIYSPAGR